MPHLLTFTTCFNPHTHAGCDSEDSSKASFVSWFQSTHPRRVWLQGYHCRYSNWCFNPHTHAGCDKTIRCLFLDIRQVSIHTPTQGVTFSGDGSALVVSFNPHTHAGCDKDRLSLVSPFFMFQSTHPRRVWLCCRMVYRRVWHVSIHTPTQGVTLYLITYYKSANLIHCYANHHYYSTS